MRALTAPSHRPLLLVLPLILAILFLSVPPAKPAGGTEPVRIGVAPQISSDSVAVTLTFSRPVAYRYEETRSRLRLWVEGEVDPGSLADRELDSPVVRRVRFDPGSHGTTIVFHLGRRFATFTSDEMRDPFRVVVTFLAEGESPDDAREEEPGSPGEPERGAPAGPTPPGGAGAPPAAGGEPLPVPELPDVSGPMRRVVIDPGHGGSEEGAVSRSGLKEKDLVLDIAQRLRDRLKASGYAAALTRDDDHAMDLESRSAAANRLKADIFLSIHANASMRGAAHGPETYFLSYGSGSSVDPDAMRLARQENLSASRGAPGGGDAELKMVLWEMAQAEYLTSSSRLAGFVQEEMNRLGGTADRGVKQAPFRVLVGAAMPAVLVEIGFLTHANEERELASQERRDSIASALAAAVERFRQDRLAAAGGRP